MPRWPAVLLLTAVAGPALAQSTRHRLNAVYPSGAQAGEVAEVSLSGSDLETAGGLWFDHPGLRAFRKGAGFAVAVGPDVPIGHHEVRAVGPGGVSNPRAFVVGDRVESAETEPNDLPEKADPLAMEATVNGRISGTADVDCFALMGHKGERVFVEVEAQRADSRLDATLQILDASGTEIAESQDVYGADPFLDLTLPADGRYVLKVHDITYGGSNEHAYRLTAHGGPHLDALVPSLFAGGETARVELIGRGIGGSPLGIFAENRPLEGLAAAFEPAVPGLLGPMPSMEAGRLGVDRRLRLGGHWSNPLFSPMALDPIVVEHEPNDREHVQAITLPCDISAAFGAPGDVDAYGFEARKGEVWRIEAEALGGNVDPTARVERIAEGVEPTIVAEGDDRADPVGGESFPLGNLDASIRWKVAEDGRYRVVVNDLFGADRGEARGVYRLSIRPERPEFRLYVLPTATDGPSSTNVPRGGRATARLLVQRLDGFAGAVRVEADGSTPGLAVDPVIVPPEISTATLVLSDDGARSAQVVRLVGRGRALPESPEIVRAARAGGLVWPVVRRSPTLGQARLERGFVVGAAEWEGSRVTIRASTADAVAGKLLAVHVEVRRSPADVGPLKLLATDWKTGQFAPAGEVAAGQNTARIDLAVPADLPAGERTLLLATQADRPGAGPSPSNAVILHIRR